MNNIWEEAFAFKAMMFLFREKHSFQPFLLAMLTVKLSALIKYQVKNMVKFSYGQT